MQSKALSCYDMRVGNDDRLPEQKDSAGRFAENHCLDPCTFLAFLDLANVSRRFVDRLRFPRAY